MFSFIGLSVFTLFDFGHLLCCLQWFSSVPFPLPCSLSLSKSLFLLVVFFLSCSTFFFVGSAFCFDSLVVFFSSHYFYVIFFLLLFFFLDMPFGNHQFFCGVLTVSRFVLFLSLIFSIFLNRVETMSCTSIYFLLKFSKHKNERLQIILSG